MGGLPGYHAQRAAELRSRTNRLAEMVSNGMTVTDAGRLLGVAETTAKNMWRTIRRGLGEQAK